MMPAHRRAGLGFLLAATWTTTALGQKPRIVVGPASHVSAAHPTDVFAESFLAINPRDQKNLVATAIVSHRDSANSQWSDVYATFDGGRTWLQGTAPPGDTMVFHGGDPVVVFDTGGTAYFARLGPGGFLLSRSSDGGRTWKLLSTVAARGFDREYLAVDQTGGKYHGRIYAVGNGAGGEQRGLDGKQYTAAMRTIALTTSTDSGRSFVLNTMVASATGDEQTHTPAEALVMPDGTVIAPFVSYSPRKDGQRGGGDGHVGVAVSRDGGRTLDAVRLGPVRHWSPGLQGQVAQSSPLRAALDRSNGPFKGRIYLTFNDYDEVRNQYVIKLVSSSDTGKTWTQPVIVNDDTTRGTMLTPAVAVNAGGVVGIVWHDRRDDPTDMCYRLYFAASTNGGATFLPNVAASSRSSCAAAPGNRALTAPRTATLDRSALRPRRTIDLAGNVSFQMIGGHTIGVVSDASGTFYAAWTSAETGVSQLWLQSFTVVAAPTSIAAIDSGRADVTEQLDLTLLGPAIDTVARTVAVTVRVKNNSKNPVVGPLTLVLDEVESAVFGDLRVVRADNKQSGRGASWNLSIGDRALLAPGDESDPLVLRWSFAGLIEPTAHGRRDWTAPASLPEPFRASFIILGGKR